MCLAVPGRIVSMQTGDALLRTGRVDFAGIVKEVNLSCVPEAAVGDFVLVHVGFALETLLESEARQVFAYLDAMGELGELGEPGEPGGLIESTEDSPPDTPDTPSTPDAPGSPAEERT